MYVEVEVTGQAETVYVRYNGGYHHSPYREFGPGQQVTVTNLANGQSTSSSASPFFSTSLMIGRHRVEVDASRLVNHSGNEDMTDRYSNSMQFTGALAEEAGVRQGVPVIPVPLPPQPGVPPGAEGGSFTSAPARAWFDPPLAQGYTFTATSGGLFKQVMSFPAGLPASYSIITEGQTYGPFTPEQSVDFVALRGHGVSSFEVRGIKPFVDATSPVAFPIMLDFTTPTLDFTMIPIAAPQVQAQTLSNGDIQISFEGVLQFSTDLKIWEDVQPPPPSPYTIPKGQISARFFRSRDP